MSKNKFHVEQVESGANKVKRNIKMEKLNSQYVYLQFKKKNLHFFSSPY